MSKFTMNYTEFFNDAIENDADFDTVEYGMKSVIAILNTYDTLNEDQRERLKNVMLMYAEKGNEVEESYELEFLDLLGIKHV